MRRIQVVGILMILVGLAILVLLGGFIVSVIVTLAKLLLVLLGLVLVLGGLAALFVWPMWRRRGPRWWGEPPAST